MNWQQYKDQVLSDGKSFIDEAIRTDVNQPWDYVFDEMFTADDVTGNGSGSYTMNSIKAKELVSDLLWDEDALDAIKDMGMNGWPPDPESADVIARCAALYQVASELEEYYEEQKEDMDDR